MFNMNLIHLQYLITMQIISTNITILFLFLGIVQCQYQAAPYAEWAHDHLLWISAREQSEDKLINMVKTYKQNGIPVGAVDIDSLWSQCINSFRVDRRFFPHFEQLLNDFHQQDIRVILWATPIVNKICPQYKEGLNGKYFLNNGKTIKWEHGEGAFVDLFNPAAKKWFTGLMNRVLDVGFDGWKCDFEDILIFLLRPWPYSPYLKRYINYRQYANQYYGTFYNYTLTKNPKGLVMSRPVDSANGKAFLNFSPKYMVFMGWVGDQTNTVNGFRQAMINIIHSASQGYLNLGFDIGGQKAKVASQKWLYLRWVQVGSLLPLMENGGAGVHSPWLFDQETVDIYRFYALLHKNLRQFFLTAGTEAYSMKQSVVQPVVKDRKRIQLTNHNNLGYVLWNTFLVSPIFDENGFVEVMFPAGHRWMYFFNHDKVLEGGRTVNMGISLNETALFVRSNSVLPFKGELWCVYLDEGIIERIIIGGQYSDSVVVKSWEGKIEIKVERFYRDQELREKMKNIENIVIRLIGVSLINDDHQSRDSIIKEQGINQTEQYSNQFTLSLALNSTTSIQNLVFTH